MDRTRQFLDMGIDPHLRGERGNALSLAACSTPRTARPAREVQQRINEVSALLLAADVDPNVLANGRTPLRCAEDSHNGELATMLATAGGRSYENVWTQFKRGAAAAGMSLVLILGGGM